MRWEEGEREKKESASAMRDSELNTQKTVNKEINVKRKQIKKVTNINQGHYLKILYWPNGPNPDVVFSKQKREIRI